MLSSLSIRSWLKTMLKPLVKHGSNWPRATQTWLSEVREEI